MHARVSHLPLQVHVIPGPQLWHSVREAETLLKGLCSSEVAPQDLRVAHVPNRLQQSFGGGHQVGGVSIHGIAQRRWRRHDGVHRLPGSGLRAQPGLRLLTDRDEPGAGALLPLQVGQKGVAAIP